MDLLTKALTQASIEKYIVDEGLKGEKGDRGEKGDKGDPGDVSLAQLNEVKDELNDVKQDLNQPDKTKITDASPIDIIDEYEYVVQNMSNGKKEVKYA